MMTTDIAVSNQKQAILDVISLLKKSFEIKDDDTSLLNQSFANQKTEIEQKIEELRRKEIEFRNNTQVQVQFIRKQRNELRKQQNDVNRQLSEISRKLDALNSQEKTVNEKIHYVKQFEQRILEKEKSIVSELERISEMSKESAINMLCEKIENEAKLKADKKAKEIVSESVLNAQKEAQNVLVYAMQKEVANVINDHSTCSIELPDESMKGKIIGREGRNIRAFEEITGVTVIIDDTPEMIVLSCYEPIRREIARIAMIKLINDGRIHPRRIEDLVEVATKEVDDIIFNSGKETAFQFQITDFHPEILKHLGKLRFRTSYSQNCLEHSKEVAQYCADMATELNLDRQLAARVALLHDIGKSIDKVVSGTHTTIGYEIIKKYGEKELVCNIVAEHHDDQPSSVYTWLIKCADALSSGRPGIRHDTFESYVRRLEHLEKIAKSFPGIKSSFAILAGRELRVAVEPEQINDDEAEKIAENIKNEIQNSATYPGEIKIVILREKRFIRTAT